jgi:hypothetical protein
MNSPFECGECGKEGKRPVKYVAGSGKKFPVEGRAREPARARKEGAGFAGTAPRQFSVMPNKNT